MYWALKFTASVTFGKTWKTGKRILCFTSLWLPPKMSFSGNVTLASNTNTEGMEMSMKQTLSLNAEKIKNWISDLPCLFCKDIWAGQLFPYNRVPFFPASCLKQLPMEVTYNSWLLCQEWKRLLVVLSCHSLHTEEESTHEGSLAVWCKSTKWRIFSTDSWAEWLNLLVQEVGMGSGRQSHP